MASLSNNKIKDTYQSLVKFNDNGNITIGAKQLTDGFGNNAPLYVSTTQIGIGITPQSGYGLHVSSNVKIGGELEVSGNLTVNGTLTYLNVVDLEVDDPLIQLAVNNAANILDIGLFGKYASSGTKYKGLFNDASDDKFKLFTGLTQKPLTTVNTSATGYTKGNLVIGGLEATTGDFSGLVTWSGGNSSHFGTGAAVTTYVGNSTVNNAAIKSNSNTEDMWIMNWGDSTAWGIYNRNIDSDLVVTNAITIPANSTAFIGAGLARTYINHTQGNIGTLGTVTAPTFSGNLTGNVTGNLTGDVTGDLTGNAYLNTIAYQGGEGTELDNNAFNGSGTGTNFRWIESNSNTTGTTWKKIADVIVTSIGYSGVQMEVKVLQPNTNWGDTAGLNTLYYSVAFRGNGSDTGPFYNNAIVYGQDANLLRVYKTANYTFELQARSNDDNRDLVVECNITSKNTAKVTFTTAYTDGTTTGGTAYTASGNALNKTKFGGNVEFEGAIFDDAEVEDLRVNELLYFGSGATSGYGPHIKHSDSGGTGEGMRITVESDLQVWGVTGNAGEQNQGLYVAGGVAKLYDMNGVVLETVLGGVDVTGDLDITGLISNSYSGTSAHILQNSTSNGTVLQLNCTGDNSSLYLQGDHIFASGTLVIGNASSGANLYRATSHDFESGTVKISTINNATTDTDKFLVSDSGVIKYRTGAEVASDILGNIDDTFVRYDSTLQTTSEKVMVKLKNTVTDAGGYGEIHILNDNDDKIVVGSIGSGYTGVDWIGATYVYNLGTGRKMYIKSQDELRFFSGGNSITSNTALVLDTSQNASFTGSITATSVNPSKFTAGGIRTKYLAIFDGTSTQTGGLYMEKTITGAGTSTNTVLFAEGGNNIQFATNGSASPKMVIDTDGDVGIGKTNPDAPLVVYRTNDVWHTVIGNDTGQLRIGGQTSSGAVIQSRNQAGTSRDLYLQRDGGKIGIGTNNPNALLSLGDTGGQKLYVYESGVIRSGFGIDLSGSSRELSIFTSSSNGTTGNISFGYRLETNGSYVEKMRLASSGDLTVESSIQWSGGVGRLISNQLQSGYNQNADNTDFWINYQGYQGGTTYFRDFRIGDGKQNQIAFFDGSTRNVGIGDTSPDYRLTVAKVNAATPAFMVSGAYYGGPRIQTYGLDADSNAWMGLGTDMSGGAYEHNIYFSDYSNLGRLSIGTYNGTTYSEKMCVLRTGNVGISTTDPKTLLHIGPLSGGNSTAQERLRLSGDYTGTNSGALLRFTNQHDSASNPNSGEYNLAGITGFDFRSDWGGALALQTAPNTSAGGTLVNRLVINPEGLVGIGTNNPGVNLQVEGAFRVNTDANSQLNIKDGGTNAIFLGAASGDELYIGPNNVYNLRLKVDGNVVMDNGGSFGIGTGTPNALLSLGPAGGQKMYVYESGTIRAGFGIDLSGSSRELSMFHTSSNGADGNTSFGYRLESNGTYQERMRVTGAGAVNIGTTATYTGTRLNVEGERMGVRTSNSSWGQLYVANPNDGEVGIAFGAGGTGRPGGTSTYTRQWIMGLNPFGTSVTKFSLTNKTFGANPSWTCTDTGLMGIRKVSPSYALDVTGDIRASADIIAYSDKRVKENIITIDNALNKVTQLRGVTYTRKDIEDKSTKIGVIAQEVLEVLPEVVSQDDEGKYSVAYGNMAGVFIEAIKELENRIKKLENKPCNCNCK